MAKLNQKIVPYLWFTKDAEEAARFYVSIFPDSRVDSVNVMPAETPSGPEGSVTMVDFTLFGQKFGAMSAGKMDPFNHAISLMVMCDTQAEIDKYWNAFLEGGGKAEQCGWIADRFGVVWQITPSMLDTWVTDKDKERGRRVTKAMLEMVKLDIAKLKAAYDGK